MNVMKVSFNGQIATLNKQLIWDSEFRALEDSLNRTYNRTFWEERHEKMLAAREPAFELAYMTAEVLGGEVLSAPDGWGMPEAPDGARR